MPDMRLSIAGRVYSVTCQPGEEQHLARLGSMLDAAARKAGVSGGLTETRGLLFAGLLLADELAECQDREVETAAKTEADTALPDRPAQDDDGELAARAIERLAGRIENLAEALEKQANQS